MKCVGGLFVAHRRPVWDPFLQMTMMMQMKHRETRDNDSRDRLRPANSLCSCVCFSSSFVIFRSLTL